MYQTIRKKSVFVFVFVTIAFSCPSFAIEQSPLQAAIARLTPEQQAALKAYQTARTNFERQVDQYWTLIDTKRTRRRNKQLLNKPVTLADYVKTQPPEYKGPKRPSEIYAMLPRPPRPVEPVEPKPTIPVVNDFLREAEANYGFRPERVTEDEFMIAYAMEAMRLGLSKDQVVRVYALETGGMGTFDLQSGFNPRTGHAASTAIGYAQLLAANTIEQIRKEGAGFAERLERVAVQEETSYEKARHLRAKAHALRNMIADALTVRDSWPSHLAYAKTPKGLGMHSLNLDGDIGPWMQVVKLKSIKDYAAKKGMGPLTGAQLEMMNLAGPNHGYEMMHPGTRDIPTANFFDRGGYERNPIVHNRTGVMLLTKINEIMDRNTQKQGALRFAHIFDGIGRKMATKRTSGVMTPSAYHLAEKTW